MGRILKVVAALVHGASPITAWRRASSAKDHNNADIRFVRAMITHHLQAIHMADLALQRADDAWIVTQARALKLSRPSEVQRLTTWLDVWSEAAPGLLERLPGVLHPGHGVGASAMIADADLHEVQASEGRLFDLLWLQMMIKHHKRAADAAKTEQADGSSPEATRLARQLEFSEEKIASQMQAYLNHIHALG